MKNLCMIHICVHVHMYTCTHLMCSSVCKMLEINDVRCSRKEVKQVRVQCIMYVIPGTCMYILMCICLHVHVYPKQSVIYDE